MRLTVRQAAGLLGLTRHTIARMFHQGKLKGIQPNSKILIDRESVDRILDRRQRKRNQETALHKAVQPVRRKG